MNIILYECTWIQMNENNWIKIKRTNKVNCKDKVEKKWIITCIYYVYKNKSKWICMHLCKWIRVLVDSSWEFEWIEIMLPFKFSWIHMSICEFIWIQMDFYEFYMILDGCI
jgi:hypothetical protein